MEIRWMMHFKSEQMIDIIKQMIPIKSVKRIVKNWLALKWCLLILRFKKIILIKILNQSYLKI